MKRICIVIQSAAFAKSAGMRVRYERFIAGTLGMDVAIIARPLADLIDLPVDQDIYIFCKTFSADAIVFASIVKRHGKIVAQDLFDDYFSQLEDQRLFSFREWLSAMAPLTDVVICTTDRMRYVLQPYFPATPITAIEDPVHVLDLSRIAALATRKAARVRASNRIRLAWFGIGDNPFFRIGITNLTAPETVAALAEFQASRFDVSLKIVTNDRALSPDGLAMLRTLPVEYELVEWSEEVETAVLLDSDVALLPVGSQGFSIAKSLNRALTALSEGCQILSLEADLYRDLRSLRYRSAGELIEDLAAGSPRLSPDHVPALGAFVATRANAFDLGPAFVAALLDGAPKPAMPLAVIHGRDTTIGLHKLASRHGLSVRSPYAHARWNFPVRFDLLDGGVQAKVSRALAERERVPLVAGSDERINDLDFGLVSPGAYAVIPAVISDFSGGSLASTAVYGRVMRGIQDAMQFLFPAYHCVIGDMTPYRADFGRRTA